MDVTYHASRSYSSVMRLGSSTLALLAVSIKGVQVQRVSSGSTAFSRIRLLDLKFVFISNNNNNNDNNNNNNNN